MAKLLAAVAAVIASAPTSASAGAGVDLALGPSTLLYRSVTGNRFYARPGATISLCLDGSVGARGRLGMQLEFAHHPAGDSMLRWGDRIGDLSIRYASELAKPWSSLQPFWSAWAGFGVTSTHISSDAGGGFGPLAGGQFGVSWPASDWVHLTATVGVPLLWNLFAQRLEAAPSLRMGVALR